MTKNELGVNSCDWPNTSRSPAPVQWLGTGLKWRRAGMNHEAVSVFNSVLRRSPGTAESRWRLRPRMVRQFCAATPLELVRNVHLLQALIGRTNQKVKIELGIVLGLRGKTAHAPVKLQSSQWPDESRSAELFDHPLKQAHGTLHGTPPLIRTCSRSVPRVAKTRGNVNIALPRK